jgi:hypothetical protein
MAACFITWTGVLTGITGTTVMGGQSSGINATPKTMLQLAPFKEIRVVEWGYHLFAVPTVPGIFELVDTGTVFATVTPGAIANYNNANGAASQAVIGSGATGFNASAEGTFSSGRLLAETADMATVFKQQFPLGREPEVKAGNCLRIRSTSDTTTALNMRAYLIWEE